MSPSETTQFNPELVIRCIFLFAVVFITIQLRVSSSFYGFPNKHDVVSRSSFAFGSVTSRENVSTRYRSRRSRWRTAADMIRPTPPPWTAPGRFESVPREPFERGALGRDEDRGATVRRKRHSDHGRHVGGCFLPLGYTDRMPPIWKRPHGRRSASATSHCRMTDRAARPASHKPHRRGRRIVGHNVAQRCPCGSCR